MEPFETVIENLLKSVSPVSPATIGEVMNCGTLQIFSKNERIFSAGKYNAYEYFQLEGVAHRFNIDPENQVTTTGIYSGPQVITPHFARTIDSQSIFSLQALTDVLYFIIPIGAFDALRSGNEQLRTFGQRVVEREFIRHLNYEVMFRSCSAKERLLHFRSAYPLLENLIPHTVISSYLGITPVSFSRLRHELARSSA